MVACIKCEDTLQWETFNTPDLSPCPSCGVLTRVNVFPALFKEHPPGRRGEALPVDQGAACFYHQKKKAIIPCEACGRFLCALCDVEFNGRHVCPSCLELSRTKHKIKNLENNRTLYDTIALALAIIPMLMVWPTIITAPLAIFMAIRYWNAPTSILPRTKARLISAMIIAGLQIAGWIILISYLVTRTGT